MSGISINSTPDARHVAFNPVLYEVESTRINDGVTYTGFAPTDNAGYCQFDFATAHGWEVDDVVQCSGHTYLPDGDYPVKSVTTNTVTIDLVWDASYAGDTGSKVKNNQNLHIEVRIYYNLYDLAAVKKVFPINDVFQFDLQKILQALISYDKADLSGSTVEIQSPDPSNASVKYFLQLQERWTDRRGTQYTDAAYLVISTIGGEDIRAFNAALNTDFTLGGTGTEQYITYELEVSRGGKFLTHKKEYDFRAGEKTELHFMTIETSAFARFTPYLNGIAQTPVDTAVATINNDRGMVKIVFDTIHATAEKIEAKVMTGLSDLSETITFNRKTNALRGSIVRWKNLLGGIDTYHFPDETRKISLSPSIYEGETLGTAMVENAKRLELLPGKISSDDSYFFAELCMSRYIWIGDFETAVPVKQSLTYLDRDYQDPKIKLRLNDEITS